jgi:beta-xylosidase
MDHPSVSDEFEGPAPGKQWNWIRENNDHWSMSEYPGYLTITTQGGDIQDASNNAENILLQSANSDWVIESKLEFNRRPANFGEQAGIVAYQDDDNYVKLTFSYTFGGIFSENNEFIELAVEREGSQHTAAQFPTGGLFHGEEAVSLVFRLRKQGSSYEASYSKEGEKFESLGSTHLVMSDIQAGIMTCGGEETDAGMFSFLLSGQDVELEPLKAKFAYFHIKNSASQ